MKMKDFRLEFPEMPLMMVLPGYGLPTAYGTPENEAIIKGYIVLECNYECKAEQFAVRCFSTVQVHLKGKLNRVKAGLHRLPFSFPVSASHPTCFKTEVYTILFTIQARITRGKWTEAIECARAVYVNISMIPASRLRRTPSIAPSSDYTSSNAYKEKNMESSSEKKKQEIGQLMRVSGMWAKIQPFEALYLHQTVYWGQQMPLTILLHPCLQEGYGAWQEHYVTHVMELDMVMMNHIMICGSDPLPLELTAPRPPGDIMPTLEDQEKKHMALVRQFNAEPVTKLQVDMPANQAVVDRAVRCVFPVEESKE
ncbi:hypothetical protein BG004_004152 [Podila humilis]|nr:hypothetical protein BG004_004152 [Podila humilis]